MINNNYKKLETLFDNQLKTLRKLFNKHNLDGRKVFHMIDNNKAKIISNAKNVFDIPNTICICMKENSKDIVVKLTQKEKELIRLSLEIIVQEYIKNNPKTKKEDIEYTVYGKFLGCMPTLLRKKVVVLDISEVLYDIQCLSNSVLDGFIKEKLALFPFKLSKFKPFDKEMILGFTITSPRISIIQTNKNTAKMEHAIIKPPTEKDMIRYKRFELKLQETMDNRKVPTVLRNYIMQNTKVNHSKGLIIKNGKNIIVIGTEYICNSTEVLAIRKSDEKYNDFIHNFFRTHKVDCDKNFLRYILNTIIIAYDMRTSMKQG